MKKQDKEDIKKNMPCPRCGLRGCVELKDDAPRISPEGITAKFHCTHCLWNGEIDIPRRSSR